MTTIFALSSPSPSNVLSPPKPFTHSFTVPRKQPFKSRKPLHITSAHPLQTDPSLQNLSPPIQEFWKWLTQEGIVNSKTPVKPGIVPEGLGLVAQKNIARNEVVLQVPKRLWINPDTVAASDIGSLCGGLKPWVSVALFLARERLRDDSSFKAYIGVLPEETNSTIFWSEEELVELQGSQLLRTTLGIREYVQSQFREVEQDIILPNKQLFPAPITIDDFFWAFGMLRSRAFSRLRNQNLVVIPFADLFNHNSSITTEDHAHEVKGAAGLFSWDLLFQIRSPAHVKAGEQVYIQYDLNKSNAEFALDYGFIEPNSGRDAFSLTLEISESDPFYEDKLDIAESNELAETASFDIFLGQPLPPTMLPYLRLVALGGTDVFLLESLFRNSIWGHLELPVSRANEEFICQVVRDACRSALSGYPTTIEDDERLISGGSLSSRLEIAIGVRAGEKRVLQHIDDIFKEREEQLNELEYYQERRLKQLGLVGEQGDIIFWEN